jgi:hypothetical protein
MENSQGTIAAGVILIEAHADLLRFAARHRLVERHQAERTERHLALLREKLGLRG